MADRRSANTQVHELRSGYSAKKDGPRNPPKGGFTTVRAANSGRFVEVQSKPQPKR